MGDIKKMSSKIFQSDADFTDGFYNYIESIFNNGFADAPSFLGFAKYKGCAAKTVYRYLQKSPIVRKQIADAFADCLSVGAMLGAYKGVMPIFELKNRAGWTDKHETTSVSGAKIATEKEAMDKVKKAFGKDNLSIVYKQAQEK